MRAGRFHRRWLVFACDIIVALSAVVLVARLLAGTGDRVDHTLLDGLDYLAPWWLAILVVPVCLFSLCVGRRWSGAVLAVLFLALLVFQDDWRWHSRGSVAPDSRTFTVLAFNVSHYGAGLENVVHGIKSLDPDVVLLSENCLGDGRTDGLKAAFAPYTVVSSRSNDMAVASRLPILSAREVALPSREPSRRCSRRHDGSTGRPNRSFMHVRVDLHGITVNVISVRFIGGRAPLRALSDRLAWGRYLLDTQRNECRFLLDYVSHLDGPVVFGGDLNATPSAELIRGLEVRASDAYLANHSVGLPTFPARAPVERLDYLFSLNGVVATYALRPDVRVSDHYPVLARFAVQPEAATRTRVVRVAAPGKSVVR